jgi:hypothetical protein
MIIHVGSIYMKPKDKATGETCINVKITILFSVQIEFNYVSWLGYECNHIYLQICEEINVERSQIIFLRFVLTQHAGHWLCIKIW